MTLEEKHFVVEQETDAEKVYEISWNDWEHVGAVENLLVTHLPTLIYEGFGGSDNLNLFPIPLEKAAINCIENALKPTNIQNPTLNGLVLFHTNGGKAPAQRICFKQHGQLTGLSNAQIRLTIQDNTASFALRADFHFDSGVLTVGLENPFVSRVVLDSKTVKLEVPKTGEFSTSFKESEKVEGTGIYPATGSTRHTRGPGAIEG